MTPKKTNSNKQGFKTPDNYFKNFDENLFEKISTEQVIPDSDGFKIPENYFNEFDKILFESYTLQNKSKIINLFSYRKIYYLIGTAAAILILFISIKSIHVNESFSFDDLAFSEIENYIDSGYLNLNSDEISAAFNEPEFNEISFSESTIEEEELFNYLNNNIENYNTLPFDL